MIRRNQNEVRMTSGKRSWPAKAARAFTVVMVCSVAAFAAAPASAEFGIQSFDGDVLNADGTAASQAGGHPYAASTEIQFNRVNDAGDGSPIPDESLNDVRVDLPPGLVGNPNAVPKCSEEDFQGFAGVVMPGVRAGCPRASQIGIARIDIGGVFGSSGLFPIYNMQPPPGVPAMFKFSVANVVVSLTARLRSDGDFGLSLDSLRTNQALPLLGVKITLWGLPADSRHNAERADCLSFGGVDPFGAPCTSDGPHTPLLTNPTACTPAGVGLKTTVNVDSWSGNTDSATFTSHRPTPDQAEELGVTGCDLVPFDPSVRVSLESTQPDAPTGLSFELSFPTDGLDNPAGITTGALKKATVTLPDGMTINPASAGGLTACADADLRLKSLDPMSCPESSRLGTVTATTPLLDQPLTGGIYVRPQNSSDPESGEMFRIALVLESKQQGISIRLPGSIRADEDSGRLVTTFDDNPQMPVSTINLQFKSGTRAPLVTPSTCGQKTIDAELSSWSGKTVNRQSTFTIDCTVGLGGFAPTFVAGATRPSAGAFSPFALTIDKSDGDTPLTGVKMELPTGLVAQVDGNLGTQVGEVMAYAGPGPNPFGLPGKVYLEGSYGGAPYSLRVVVRAKAGPFDLGTVEVRQKLYVDPNDAHVTVVSDPLPTIVKGVPVRLQRLDVNVDKPGFIINPTSCATKTISGTLSSASGQTVPITNRFQVGDCASLGYAPKLAMGLSGKGQTKDGAHPTLTARLATNTGDANSKKVTVTLPLSLALDVDNANGLCEPTDAAANKCPAASVVGHAKAQSILPDPLRAPVYFVRGERKDPKTGRTIKTLPRLFIPLTANGVTVNLNASSDVVGNRLVTTFDTLPDAPFSSFDLTIDGGKHGILAVSGANVCAASQVANGQFTGQNGKAFAPAITMTTQCTLGVQASSHTATALKLTISGLGAGKVAVSGDGFGKTSRTIGSATVATLSAPLTKATRQALARHRNVKVKVSVAFTPKGAKKAKRVTKTLTIHGAKIPRG
jgi:hypothetical protein